MSTTNIDAAGPLEAMSGLAAVRDEIEQQLRHAVEASRTAPDTSRIRDLAAALRSVDEICMARGVQNATTPPLDRSTVWNALDNQHFPTSRCDEAVAALVAAGLIA